MLLNFATLVHTFAMTESTHSTVIDIKQNKWQAERWQAMIETGKFFSTKICIIATSAKSNEKKLNTTYMRADLHKCYVQKIERHNSIQMIREEFEAKEK